MDSRDVVGLGSVFFAGLLAGEEFVVRYGIRGPLATLDDRAHIQLRQALIRTLRFLVPALYLPALLTAAAVTVLDGVHSGFPLRCGEVLALVVWIAVTLGGTVPINEAALEWDADAPPSSWRTQVERWERLNTVRAWAALLAFGMLLTALIQIASSA
jgi:uncharacterized membrane protein